MPENVDDDLRQAAKAAAAAAAVGAAAGVARAIATRARDASRREDDDAPADEELRDEAEQHDEPDEQAEPEPQPEPEPESEPEQERQPEPNAKTRRPARGEKSDRLRRLTETARELLEDLSGAEVEAVSALDRIDGGWRVTLEAVELRRIPDSTDVLATYDVELDGDGDLVRYERRRRYARSQSDYGEGR